MQQKILALFWIFFGLRLVVETLLNYLQTRTITQQSVPSPRLQRLRLNLPQGSQDKLTPENIERGRAYALAKLKLARIQIGVEAVLTMLLLFTPFLPTLFTALSLHFGNSNFMSLIIGLVFIGAIVTISGLVSLPFEIIATFGIEGRFGFNTQTWRTFCLDRVKGVVLGLLLGVPLLLALLAVLQALGNSAGWVLALILLVFQLFMMWAYPVFIAPFFNRFSPLGEGDLRVTLEGYLRKTSFPSEGLFVIDGSSRSQHANAFFSGFGKHRRIVLYDTLIRMLSVREVLAVLLHEIGHWRLGHVWRGFLAQAGLTLVIAFALAWCAHSNVFQQAFGYSQTHPVLGLWLFQAVLAPMGFLLSPLWNAWSRRHEFAADAYAKKTLEGDGLPLATALYHISSGSLAWFEPHSLYAAWNYGHPTLTERLSKLTSPRVSPPTP